MIFYRRKVKINSKSNTLFNQGPGCMLHLPLSGKKRVGGCILFSLIVFIVLSSRSVFAFTVPEKLVFDLTWTGVKAGTATLEIVNEKGNTRIISTARSADWVSVFYTVDDRTEAVLKNAKVPILIGLPVNYRIKLKEGRHRRDKEVIFDHANRQAIYINHLENGKKTYKISENILDPLSSFYYVRTLNFEVGKSLYVNVFDSKKLWNVEVQVLRREKIRTELGEFNTVVIKPLMKSEGIFNKKGDIYIWLTDDQKRIPVKMQSRVAVGSITATLVGGMY
jgi:hypothetical protein